MKKLTRWIAARFIKNHQQMNDLEVRAGYGMLEGWTSVVGNTILFAIKITVGLSFNSIALIADAVHTLADSVTSVVIIMGFKMARKPSDREHPFGHGRMEAIATLVVAVLLFVAGIELLESSVHAIIQPKATLVSGWVILLIIGTIIIKELMARFAYELGDMIDSRALKADALHHRSDVVATGLVVVALICSRFGYPGVDGLMGIGVSLIIAYSAYSIFKEVIDPLLGEAPSKETLKEIETLAMMTPGVTGVHDIIFHAYGQTSVVSLHLEVSDKESAVKLHDLSADVEERLAVRLGGHIITHIDPINKEHPQYETVVGVINEIISDDRRVQSFHDLRIVGCELNRCKAVFDIVLDDAAGEQESGDIVRAIRAGFCNRFPEMTPVIKVDPKFSYAP